MKVRLIAALVIILLLGIYGPASSVEAETPDELIAICEGLFGDFIEVPTTEPLAPCQWDMALIGANDDTFSRATGAGVTVGVLDTGVCRFA